MPGIRLAAPNASFVTQAASRTFTTNQPDDTGAIS
jgi:hypothetical protein